MLVAVFLVADLGAIATPSTASIEGAVSYTHLRAHETLR